MCPTHGQARKLVPKPNVSAATLAQNDRWTGRSQSPRRERPDRNATRDGLLRLCQSRKAEAVTTQKRLNARVDADAFGSAAALAAESSLGGHSSLITTKPRPPVVAQAAPRAQARRYAVLPYPGEAQVSLRGRT